MSTRPCDTNKIIVLRTGREALDKHRPTRPARRAFTRQKLGKKCWRSWDIGVPANVNPSTERSVAGHGCRSCRVKPVRPNTDKRSMSRRGQSAKQERLPGGGLLLSCRQLKGLDGPRFTPSLFGPRVTSPSACFGSEGEATGSRHCSCIERPHAGRHPERRPTSRAPLEFPIRLRQGRRPWLLNPRYRDFTPLRG